MKKIIFFLVINAVISYSAIDSTKILAPGKEAPTFSLPSLAGTRESLRMWCGDALSKPYVNDKQHIVILSFWATYCKPCQKEIPELHAFAKKYDKDPLKIFLISIDDKGAGIVAPFAEEKKYSLPILLDPYKKTAERFGVNSLPALFVIDPKGIIRYSSVGYKDDVSLEETLEKVVSAIKAGKKVTVQSTGQGESVAVQKEEQDSTQGSHYTSKQKWNAVARIECGSSPDAVAKELNVPKEELKKWYTELKDAAIELWDSQAPAGK